MKRKRHTIVGCVLVAVQSAHSFADAEPVALQQRLERVGQLTNGADFDNAEKEANALLTTGELTRQQVSLLRLAMGIIHAARGDRDAALDQFRFALLLVPNTALPETAGPHVEAIFEDARRAVRAEPAINPDMKLERRRGAELRLAGRVSGTARELVAAAVLEGPRLHQVFAWNPNVELDEARELGEPACDAITVNVTDRFGNVLWPAAATLGACEPLPDAVQAPPAVDEGATAPPVLHPSHDEQASKRASERQLGVAFWLSASATAALSGATLALGLRALDARDDYRRALHDADRSSSSKWALREAALDQQHWATLAGALGIGAGVTAVALYVWAPRRASGPGATLTVAPGIGSLSFSGTL